MDGQTRAPYIAVLIYVTHVEGDYARPRYSEDIVLIYSGSVEEARAAAETMGHGDEISYLNEYDESVNWKFIGVADVRNALYDTLNESTALYSRSFYDLARYKDVFSVSSLGNEQDS